MLAQPVDSAGSRAPAWSLRELFTLLVAVVVGGSVAVLVLPVWLPQASYTLMGMTPRVFWYMGRSSAFVAFGLLWFSMLLGLMMTNKLARAWPGGPTTMTLHQNTSLLGLAFAVFHALVLMGSRFLNYSLLDVLIPLHSAVYRPAWVALGQLALYGMAVTGLSFYVKRKITHKVWRAIHFVSFAVFVAALAHGLLSGSDSASIWAQIVYGLCAQSILCLSVYRALSAFANRTPRTSSPTAAPELAHKPQINVNDVNNVNGAGIHIVFGSQSGNAEALAKRTVATLQQAGLHADVIDGARFDLNALRQTRQLILITSTYGDGEPPDNIARFFHQVHQADAATPALTALAYSVLALGDKSYATFCKAGKDFDARLNTLGAQRLCDLALCDVDYETSYQAWLTQLIASLQMTATSTQKSRQPAISPPITSAPIDKPVEVHAERYSKTRPFAAPIVRNINLQVHADGADAQQTRAIAFSLHGSGLTYEAGDALGVMPSNRLELVLEVLRAVGFSKDVPVPLPEGNTGPLFDALLRHYDITKLTGNQVQLFAARTQDPTLCRLLQPEHADDMKSFLRGRELIDLLLAHPNVFNDAEDFVAALQRLRPRLYSISSSQKMHPDEVHLTVGVVRYTSHDRARHGVCSADLAQAHTGAVKPIFVHPNKSFRLPCDSATPVIMVGPGTGIAPFRGFLQERAATGASGKNWLFFGCRIERTDFFYRDELHELQTRGVLTRLDVACSRDQAEKIYVQDRMRQNATELWRWLSEGASFYVCGDAARMAKDVEAALHDVAVQAGGLTVAAAREWLGELRQQKRYLRDVY